jgi:hypothetical protein
VAANDREAVLRTARNALRKIEPELHHQQGFAIFAKMSSAGGLSLPQPIPSLAMVGTRFYIKPILGLLDRNPAFHILAASAGKARLLSCDHYAWTEVPIGFADGAREIVAETSFQEGGYESSHEVHKSQLMEYVRRVSGAVEERLRDDAAPLVLAAEPELLGHFRKHGHLPRLMEPGLNINPHALGDSDLHGRALELVLANTGSLAEQTLEKIHARLSAGEVTVAIQPDQIVTAALHGRVDAAVVAVDENLWGAVNASGGKVTARGKPLRNDEELLNLIVVETLKRGGRAYAVPHEAMPRNALAAALLRY